MTDERWRLFVAVSLEEELRASLAVAVERWRARDDLAALRWTDPEAWHLTLAFLGATQRDAVPGLSAALADAVRGRAPLRLAAGGLGGFPSARRARVAWYGIADPDRQLAALAAAVRRATGSSAEAPFRGHVTIARARAEPVDLRAWVTESDAPRGMLEVGAVVLMRSHLGRGPARHERLSTHPLEVTADD